MARTATPPDDDTAGRPGRRTGLDRDDVVAAALDLVEREGPAALTMRRLATELDVATPTIYWHVGSRDELVAEVIRLQSNRLAERAVEGDTPRERVFSAARHIWTSSIEHRAITSLAHQTGTSSLLAHRLEAALVDRARGRRSRRPGRRGRDPGHPHRRQRCPGVRPPRPVGLPGRVPTRRAVGRRATHRSRPSTGRAARRSRPRRALGSHAPSRHRPLRPGVTGPTRNEEPP